MKRSTSPYICAACGRPATPVLRMVDGVDVPLSRCCSDYLVRLGSTAPTPREYLAERRRRRTA